MSNDREIASGLEEIWGRLNERWTGEDAKAFHRQYIAKMSEAAENFEEACSGLSAGAADLAKKLALIERDIT